MKRVVSLFAAAALAASLLAGCGQTGESDWEYVQEKGTLKIGITLFEPMNYYDPEDPDHQDWFADCTPEWVEQFRPS